MLLVNQDNENPIAIDVTGIADDTKRTDRNLYEIFDTSDLTKVPGGGW